MKIVLHYVFESIIADENSANLIFAAFSVTARGLMISTYCSVSPLAVPWLSGWAGPGDFLLMNEI